jgi:hypothetical protein
MGGSGDVHPLFRGVEAKEAIVSATLYAITSLQGFGLFAMSCTAMVACSLATRQHTTSTSRAGAL